MKLYLLINKKIPTIVGISISISREIFMLRGVKHSKGLSEILRDIRTSTYQIFRIEEK